MRGRANIRYCVRLTAIILLVSIFVAPPMLISPLNARPSQHIVPAADIPQQLPSIDPKLKELLNNPTSSNVQVIVLLKDGSDPRPFESIRRLTGCKLITTFSIIPAALVELPLNKVSELFSVGEIKSIYLNREIKIEPVYQSTGIVNLRSPGSPWIDAINASSLRSMFGGMGIKVAIADSGIDSSHLDLSGKVIDSASFVRTAYNYTQDEDTTDNFGHGTYVAGIVAGAGVISPDYQGVAPRASLISAKCIDMFGQGFTAGIIKAVEWSVNQSANVINLSLGGGSPDPDDPLSLAVDNAVRKGVVVVVSAGNEGPSYSTGGVPAAARLAISVGASDGTSSIASFSSRGPTIDGRAYPDVLAPGVNIVSTLATDSAIFYYATRVGLTTGDYVSLSGTSAAAPLVSGSVALLLSSPLLSTLNSTTTKAEIAATIRIALMNTSTSLGSDVNTFGSGLINVGNAYQYLSRFGSRSHYPIMMFYPSQLVNPPYFVGYLGDSIEVAVSVLAASTTNLTVSLNGGNATQFTRLGNSSFTNIVGLSTLHVNVSIPVNASLGRYMGQILFRNTTSGALVGSVSTSFTVAAPKGRMYFDLFHTDSIYSTKSTLYKLASDLTAHGYSIYEDNSPITYSKISQYDILVLPDPRIMFGSEELVAIQRFVEGNGSLLILGDHYPNMVTEAVNGIIARYGIRYALNYVANYFDLAIEKHITSDVIISNLSTHPITSGVGSYLFGFGSSLFVNASKADSLAFSPQEWNYSPILAACDVPNGGRIIASGSIQFTLDDHLNDASFPGNKKLIENIVNWLLSKKNATIETIASKTRVRSGETFGIGAMVINRTSGQLLHSIQVEGTSYNGTWIPIGLTNISGIHYNMSITLQSEGFYSFHFNMTYLGQQIARTLEIEVVNSPPEIQNIALATYHNPAYPLPQYLQGLLPSGTPMITRYGGDYVNFTVTTSSISNVTIYLTRYPNFYLPNSKTITCVTLKTTPTSATTYYAKYMPTPNNSTDVYMYWISATSGNHSSIFNEVNMIMVASIDPQLSNVTSTINSQPLTALPPSSILSVRLGDTISVVVNGTDVEDDGAGARSTMKAYAILIDPYLYYAPGFLYSEVVLSALQYDNTSQSFRGTLTIPFSTYVYTLASNTELAFPSSLYALFLLLVDSDGAYSLDYAYVWVVPRVETPVLMIFTVLLISVAVPVMIILIIQRRTRVRLTEGAPPEY